MNAYINLLRDKRDQLHEAMRGLTDKVAAETRDFSDAEKADFDALVKDHAETVTRLAELEEAELRQQKAAELSAKVNPDGTPQVRIKAEPEVYDGQNGNSFFADLAVYRMDPEARDRLIRHEKMHARDGSTAAGSFGEFTPTVYMLSDYARFTRHSRPVANLVRSEPLTGMVKNWPRVTTGVSVAVQSSEGGNFTESDIVSTSVNAATLTVNGYTDLSIQARDFASISDEFIFADLAAAYAAKVESLFLTSTTNDAKGLFKLSGTNSVLWDDASPTESEFRLKVAAAVNAVNVNRKAAPTVIIMHPRRWNWLRAQGDSNLRAVISPVAPQNSTGLFGSLGAEGVVGEYFGLPVVTSLGIGTDTDDATPGDQDEVAVCKIDDSRLAESGLKIAVHEQPLGSTGQVRFVMYGHVAFTHGRFPSAISRIHGNGLNNPF